MSEKFLDIVLEAVYNNNRKFVMTTLHYNKYRGGFDLSKTLLEVKNLKTSFNTEEGLIKAVNDVSFNIEEGQTFGVVGESGCGKSVTALSILQLVQEPKGSIDDGKINY